MRVNCAPPVNRDATREDLARHRNAATLALLSFAMLIVSLDQYIVVVALPDIGRDLGYSAQTLQSVISAYAVASSGFLLFGGRAADLLGRRRMLVTGLALYAVASLAGGLATGPEVQLAARAVQGLGGALVFPSTLALINTTFAEGHDRNRALGIWGGAGAAGLVVGVLLGGVLTRAFGWEAVFFVNVPLAGAALILAFRLIEADRARDTDRTFDLPGALTVTAAITLLVFALVQGPDPGWGSPGILVAAAIGLVLLGLFHRHRAAQPRSAGAAATARQPLSSRWQWRSRSCSWRRSAPLLYFLSIYFQDVRGYDALQDRRRIPASDRRRRGGFSLAGQAVTRFGLRRTLVTALTHRRSRRCRAGTGDVARCLLRLAHPRPHRCQHRRWRRVHDDVHRRGDRSDRSRAGRCLRHRLHRAPESAPRSASPSWCWWPIPAGRDWQIGGAANRHC